MNLHELSIRITQIEGKKKPVNIAQTKEIIKALGFVFNEISLIDLFRLVKRIKKGGE